MYLRSSPFSLRLSVFECLPYLCSLDMLPCWKLKTLVLCIPRSWLPCSCVKRDRKTDPNSNLCVYPPFCFRFYSVFSFHCFPMDPFFRPKFLLLLLEQGDKSLEDHTRLFLMLANATCYPDGTLCSFYNASLNTACRALSSEDGPRGDFAAYVEWTLARNGSPLAVCPEDDLARSTPDPEPSPPSPCGAEHQPEPTDDGEPFPAAICEPAQSGATERKIVPEVEPNPSNQVRERATVPTTREPAVDGVSAEWSSASCTAAEGELIVHLGLLDMEGDLIDWSTELEIELPPLLSPSSPLVPSSPPSSPLVPASSAPPERPPVPAPRKFAGAGVSLRLRLGRASTRHRLWIPLLWLRLVAPSHRLCWAPFSRQLHLGPQSLRLRRGSPDLRLRLGRQSPWLHPGPPDPLHPPGSLALRLHLGLLHHLLRRRWSAPWSRRPSLLHGSSLRRLHRGPSSWLWPGSCCAPPAPGPSCLFPGSSLLRRLPGLCLPAPSRVSVLLLSRLQSSHPPLPFGCFCGARAHLPGGGRYVTCQDCLVFFAPHVFCDLVSPSCWLLIWFQVCLVISPLIVCVFKVQSIQFAFVGLWVSSQPVLPWYVTLLEIKDSSFVYSSSPRSWLPCSCVKRDYMYIYLPVYIKKSMNQLQVSKLKWTFKDTV